VNSVTLTAEQAKLVMQCLDLACKHGGLNAAAQILPVATAIEEQLTKPAAAYGSLPEGVTFESASAEAVAGLSAVPE
jgi:hypothetical protein